MAVSTPGSALLKTAGVDSKLTLSVTSIGGGCQEEVSK
jgi:hypothetical protein